ncbi:hypothetical protein ScPMuIL_004475 [Solemya velum]
MADPLQSFGVLSKVSFVNKISKIMKATSDDEKPIPGYLYAEISNITLESEGFCESTVEFLVDRLNKKSCHVKIKVLKLMKYILENGSPHFKDGLQKQSRGIQEATNYGGPPDPLHGNVPFLMVRKTAKEVNEVLFATNSESSRSSEARQNKGSVNVGMGSTQDGRMGSAKGFGNVPVNQAKSIGESIVDGISRLAERMSETSEDQQRALLTVLDKPDGSYRPPVHVEEGPVFEEKPQAELLVTRRSHQKHIAGRAGGGWEDEDIPLQSADHKRSLESRSGDSGELSDRLESELLEDWSKENELVCSTVEKGQDRMLTRAEISSFLKSCLMLNCDKILETVNLNLSSSDENKLMASLLIIEGLLSSDLVNLDFLVRVCKDSLLNLFHSREGPVKSKSRKIIRILEKLTSYQNLLPLPSMETTDKVVVQPPSQCLEVT